MLLCLTTLRHACGGTTCGRYLRLAARCLTASPRFASHPFCRTFMRHRSRVHTAAPSPAISEPLQEVPRDRQLQLLAAARRAAIAKAAAAAALAITQQVGVGRAAGPSKDEVHFPSQRRPEAGDHL